MYSTDEASRRETPRRRRERRRGGIPRARSANREAGASGARERGRGRSLARRTPEVPWAASFAAASRAHRSRSRRDAQDCDPKAYMHTPSGRMDAHAARAAQGARLNIARGRRPSRRRRSLEACETCRALTGKDRHAGRREKKIITLPKVGRSQCLSYCASLLNLKNRETPVMSSMVNFTYFIFIKIGERICSSKMFHLFSLIGNR